MKDWQITGKLLPPNLGILSAGKSIPIQIWSELEPWQRIFYPNTPSYIKFESEIRNQGGKTYLVSTKGKINE